MGYNFTFKAWYIVSAEEIKRQSFHQQGFIFQSLSNQFHNLLNPLQKDDPTRSSFALQQTEDKMINWFNIPDEGLSNGGLFEVKELEVTENGTYETKGEMYNKVTVNVEGGGGSSDFSTAEVTMVNDSADTTFLVLTENGAELNVVNVGTYEIPLYRGHYLIKSATVISAIEDVSGNIEQLGSGKNVYYDITGDCTITFVGIS